LSGMPFVFAIECALYVWLYHPKTEGAELIHHYALDPLLKKHGKVIEENLNNVRKAMDGKRN